jgi:phage major head subunit gpT-like protein
MSEEMRTCTHCNREKVITQFKFQYGHDGKRYRGYGCYYCIRLREKELHPPAPKINFTDDRVAIPQLDAWLQRAASGAKRLTHRPRHISQTRAMHYA